MPVPIRCPNDPTHRRFRRGETGTLLDNPVPDADRPGAGNTVIVPGGLRPLFDEHLAPVCVDCGAAGIMGEAE